MGSLASHLNLARSLRCHSFDELIGQEFVIRFLKNSLYKGILHPLYLFSGMRGTGKTTVARIFSCAMACFRLSDFQNNPSHSKLPCGTCDSCLAFFSESHPDIYEIDAASHTGVETIRSLIDNAYLSPVLSTKKIYIIDEAHMLSKAAFNACLKLMEEPPAHVHFILATTDSNKILDTVRSRSIFLSFKPLQEFYMIQYLEKVCIDNSISFTRDGLAALFDASQGSVRDALNALDSLRMVHDDISFENVSSFLGIPLSTTIDSLINSFVTQDTEQGLLSLQALSLSSFLPQAIWLSLCKNIRRRLFALLVHNENEMVRSRLIMFLDLMYEYEACYISSHQPSGIIELIFYRGMMNGNDRGGFKKNDIIQNHTIQKEEIKKLNINESSENYILSDNLASSSEYPIANNASSSNENIALFLKSIKETEKVLHSIFSQAKLLCDYDNKKITCLFDKKFLFYRDFIEEKKHIWEKIVHEIFGKDFFLLLSFEKKEEKYQVETKKIITDNNEEIKKKYKNFENSNEIFMSKKTPHNTKTSLFIKSVMDIFPGKFEHWSD